MRIVCLKGPDAAGGLIQDEAPVPKPGGGEVLIQVAAAGVIFTELLWDPTTHTKSGAPRSRAVPGHEFSGVVAALGQGASGIATGEEIYGMNDWYSDGALAEYCVAPAAAVAPKPRTLTHVEAASVPISALTAWQGLFSRGKLQAGERVLVHGGAGAVGMFVIQLAHLHGAHVITTASAENHDFVRSLGAEQAIDYHQSRFEDRAGNVDLVFDTVGGETLDRSWKVLKPGGRLVTIVSTLSASGDPRVKQAFFIVEPDKPQLLEVGALLDAGRLRTEVGAVVPLSQAPELYAGRMARHRGKVVVVPDQIRK